MQVQPGDLVRTREQPQRPMAVESATEWLACCTWMEGEEIRRGIFAQTDLLPARLPAQKK